MTKDLACPFCEIADRGNHERILDKNEHVFVIRDGSPVTDGHSLVVSVRHIHFFSGLYEAKCNALLTPYELLIHFVSQNLMRYS